MQVDDCSQSKKESRPSSQLSRRDTSHQCVFGPLFQAPWSASPRACVEIDARAERTDKRSVHSPRHATQRAEALPRELAADRIAYFSAPLFPSENDISGNPPKFMRE